MGTTHTAWGTANRVNRLLQDRISGTVQDLMFVTFDLFLGKGVDAPVQVRA